MNRFHTISNRIIIAIIITLSLTLASNAQFGSGAWGLNAGIALPAGITQSVALPSGSLSNVTFAPTASANLVYLFSQSFALQFGVGYLSVGQTPQSGPSPDAVTTLSFTAGGKYYLRHGDVMTYLGAGFSFTNLPKFTSGNDEVTNSLIMIFACFGAEGFLNSSKTLSVFIQMGFGYNMLSYSAAMSNQNTLNLGGSAVGANIYF
ncbi:MAG: hypothetical protein A2X61_03700 [Ignavibacteria bacterium GWB2_35_12]|nr:MAG: hypothetical protein A2X63_00865 [Ignavibacteria bacterium GWA2_35_8]OGU40390.1 MAG: hypothetical protein A2X61_03700 [Ignavibacteria bacterium GWB2_35_12]OGU92183.1 MAG: hypothetical protein A2220_13640 [Ignavibacteria bacterium RIFOXYA2_FULL_35_10]OGV22526.1 MAG: hypothetical protein A2475_03375 [Ignavibacteria bacterium RIFOXYC2_FULL_35_21]